MKTRLYLFLLIAFTSLLMFLGNWGLTDSSEARYAEISREMLISNDYITPTLLGIKHLHKPPVTYYLTVFSYKIFGVNEFGARFFMQLALVFQIFLVFKITVLLYKNEKLAFLTSLIYFSFPITVIAVRTLTTDAYLTTFILASIYFWLRHRNETKPYLLYLFYIFLGLIFETKGPVGLIVPVFFIIFYKIIYKEKIIINFHQIFGFIVFLIISASWYVVIMIQNEGLFDYFFKNQLVERVSKNTFSRGKPFWYYFLLLPVLGFPWVLYLISFFKNNLTSIYKKRNIDFVLLLTFLVMFVILSLSTSKLILYILPVYFILAIFTAKYLISSTHCVFKKTAIVYLSLTFISTLGVLIIPYLNLGFNINYRAAILIFIIFNLGSFLIFKKLQNTNYYKPAYLGVIFTIALIFSANHLFKSNELKFKSVKPIAEFIKQNSTQNPTIIVYNYLLPSLSFYLDQKIITVNGGRDTTTREIEFETNNDWKKNLFNYSDKNDRIRLSEIKIKKPTYLIRRYNNEFPDTLQIIANQLKNRKDFEKFIIYY